MITTLDGSMEEQIKDLKRYLGLKEDQSFQDLVIDDEKEECVLKKIASFTVDHDTLERGIHVSRVDGDVITYDIRMKIPNGGDYLENAALHTFEHLFATFARNSKFEKSVIYVGPMGCRTGFYLLMRDGVSRDEVIALVRDTFVFVRDFEGVIPGSSKKECGNYLEHDLKGAKKIALEMLEVLK